MVVLVQLVIFKGGVSMTPEEQIIICAVRYALGRRSYIVSEVCQYVANKKTDLSKNCIKCIIRDIEEEFKLYRELGRTLGDYCDERCWEKLLGLLKKEVNNDAE